MFLEANKAQIM